MRITYKSELLEIIANRHFTIPTDFAHCQSVQIMLALPVHFPSTSIGFYLPVASWFYLRLSFEGRDCLLLYVWRELLDASIIQTQVNNNLQQILTCIMWKPHLYVINAIETKTHRYSIKFHFHYLHYSLMYLWNTHLSIPQPSRSFDGVLDNEGFSLGYRKISADWEHKISIFCFQFYRVLTRL